MFAAVLDTNVIWPSLRRDFLLSLAVEGLYRPLWSEAILEELEYHEEEKLVRRGTPRSAAQAKAQRLIEQMRRHFADALVAGWEHVRPYGLPDPDDEHVLAAALIGGAGAIVTENHVDFPAHVVPGGVAILSAADFARDTVSVDPQGALRAVQEMSQRRTGQSPEDLIDLLETRYAMHAAAALLRDA